MKAEPFTPGSSPFPPLSPERVAAAKARHGEAVDRYLECLHIGDPLADALTLHFATLPPGDGMKMLNLALEEGIGAVEDAPDELRALFAELDRVPLWVDWDRMRHASAKICRNGFLVALSFATYALPHSYLANGNKPLAFTAELLNATPLRFARTARFVVETFYPQGLRRDADGFKWAVLMRMMHARARQQLLRSGQWDCATYGLPINQAHMAMNAVFFSFYVLKGMQRMGVRFTPQEVESILLTWRYVGYLFGIHPEMVYTSEYEAQRLLDIGFSLEFDPDEDSKRLCKSMMEAGPAFLKIDDPRLAQWEINLVYTMSRHLLGDGLADRLGFPPARHRWLGHAFMACVRGSEWLPFLVPAAVRNFMGMEFWLDMSDYESVPFGQHASRPPA